MKRLTAIVLTYNEEKHIAECLASLDFTDEQIVFDSFSNDNTIEIARQCGARVVQHAFDNYTAQRNAALDEVDGKTEWVLFVDADERVTPMLADEILEAIEKPDVVGWRIPRHNYLFGKLTKGAGWYPDYQTRLLKVGHAQYDRERKVHEVVVLDGAEGTLAQPFIHHNYEDVAQFVAKQQKYTRYDAQMLLDEGVRPKPYTYFTQPVRHFWWRFITLKGYSEGWHGLRLSILMAWYEFRKYWLLKELLGHSE